MTTATLQQLMVINKGRSLPLLIKTKSALLDIATWALWGYVITFVARYADRIFTKPIIDSLLLIDIVRIMFTASGVLVVLDYVWYIIKVETE